MPLMHCTSCCHEWEACDEDEACDWCGHSGFVLKKVTGLEALTQIVHCYLGGYEPKPTTRLKNGIQKRGATQMGKPLRVRPPKGLAFQRGW